METDDDGDSFSECLDGDCDDGDATLYVGAPELCDGLDNDCDTLVPAAETTDDDGDGLVDCAGCDDASTAPCVPVVPCTGMFSGLLPADSCAALNWAVNLAFLEDATPLLDQLEAEIALVGTGSCPAYSSTSSTVHPTCSWFPSRSQTTETWAGGCSGGGLTTSGSLVRLDEYESCDVFWSSTDSMTGTGFDADWTGAGPSPGLDLYTLDGVLAEVGVGTLDSTGPWSSGPSLDATVDVVGTFAGPALTLAFPEGRTIVDHYRTYTQSGDGQLCWGFTQGGAMALTATARALTAPWVATGSGSWQDNPCAAPNCMAEPVSGSVSVDVYAVPGGPIVRSASVVFNGATACDGCGEVFDDGVSVGTVCNGIWAN